jgi:hypothetical protein
MSSDVAATAIEKKLLLMFLEHCMGPSRARPTPTRNRPCGKDGGRWGGV